MKRTGILRTASFAKSKAKCKNCKVNPVFRPGATACSPECAEVLVGAVKEKAARIAAKKQAAADRTQRQNLKSNMELANDAQAAVNKYVNLRDFHIPCICCGKCPYSGVRHAGHFKSRGANSFLRFNLWNINSCCYSCNAMKGGNINEYRPNLIKKIGIVKVNFLDCSPKSRVYSSGYLIRLKKIFQRKCKRLKTRQEGL